MPKVIWLFLFLIAVVVCHKVMVFNSLFIFEPLRQHQGSIGVASVRCKKPSNCCGSMLNKILHEVMKLVTDRD